MALNLLKQNFPPRRVTSRTQLQNNTKNIIKPDGILRGKIRQYNQTELYLGLVWRLETKKKIIFSLNDIIYS